MTAPKDLIEAVKDWIFIKVKSGHHIKIQKDDILVLEADDNCTYIHTADKKYCVTRRIGKLAEEIAYPGLVRVHKSYFVHINKIKELVGADIIINNMEIPVSKNFTAALKEVLMI